MTEAKKQTQEKPREVGPLEFAKMLGNKILKSRDDVIEFGKLYEQCLFNSQQTEIKLNQALEKIVSLRVKIKELEKSKSKTKKGNKS